MVRISENLIRRRAEHNNGEIFSLEELSLHQQDIEKIEHIDKWCKDLKILYLHNNLISTIENLGRLKKLVYVNLTLNNIEVIENLEGCESLQKLDLTVNFVGKLSSVRSLKQNIHFRELFLVGNPCSDFQGYRKYVVALLTQLQCLDGIAVKQVERIQAVQDFDVVKTHITEQEAEYLKKREKQKRNGSKATTSEEDQGLKQKHIHDNLQVSGDLNDSEINQNGETKTNSKSEKGDFMHTTSAFTPESRLETHQHLEDMKRAKDKGREKTQTKKPRTLITQEGRVLNVNEPKLEFNVSEDESNNCIQLDLHVYRHMDTSLLDVDVQPMYVRVTVKGKVFQLVLPAEVKPDSSTAQRSQTTGHLLLILPLAHSEIKPVKTTKQLKTTSSVCNHNCNETRKAPGRELLEVDPGLVGSLANIVVKERASSNKPFLHRDAEERPVSENFVDDPDVPPLL